MSVQARSGRPLAEITLAAAAAHQLGIADVGISGDQLEHQAAVAEAHGNPHLAENLRRAAEVGLLPDARVLAIYEALRPRRSTRAQLEELSQRLEEVPAPRCAALVREALTVYARRGLLLAEE